MKLLQLCRLCTQRCRASRMNYSGWFKKLSFLPTWSQCVVLQSQVYSTNLPSLGLYNYCGLWPAKDLSGHSTIPPCCYHQHWNSELNIIIVASCLLSLRNLMWKLQMTQSDKLFLWGPGDQVTGLWKSRLLIPYFFSFLFLFFVTFKCIKS